MSQRTLNPTFDCDDCGNPKSLPSGSDEGVFCCGDCHSVMEYEIDGLDVSTTLLDSG